jgi:formamidopyrimidine-DNA glycosylase
MPELPEVATYLETLGPRLVGQPLEAVRIRSPSLLRTYDPPVSALTGRTVTGLRRIGKRIVWELDGDRPKGSRPGPKDARPGGGGGAEAASQAGGESSPMDAGAPLFAVFHLMIAGRFKWRERGAAVPKKRAHGAFDFPTGTLLLTEAGTKKRASLHVVRGEEALAGFERGGLDVLTSSLDDFADAITRENRTLKRALTDPRILDGIGNAHSDEILWRARLSPTQRSRNLSRDEIARLHEASRTELAEWTARLIEEAAGEVPEKVTAFHPAMAVHGRYREPCPRCDDPIQRIRYASSETNYCATCQTGGRVLADRGISRLLGDDWPRTLEELEELYE